VCEVPTVVADIIEMDSACEPKLRRLHPDAQDTIHMTNMLDIPSHTLNTADIFIAGYPCPPFAGLGNRRGTQDERSLVFLKGLEDLTELAQREDRKALKIYVLEYVTGATKASEGEVPFSEQVTAELAVRLPHFAHAMWIENANEHGLPQIRNRVFFVGVNRLVTVSEANRQFNPYVYLQAPIEAMGVTKALLRDFLLVNDTPCADLTTRTLKQRTNIAKYKALYDQFRGEAFDPSETNVGPAQCCVCDHSRDPDKKFGSFLKMEESFTITCTDTAKWVIGDIPNIVADTGRPLTVAERAMCFGIVPETIESFFPSKKDQIRVLGNTMCVDVVGAVLASLLPVICEWEAAQHPEPSRPLTLSHPHKYVHATYSDQVQHSQSLHDGSAQRIVPRSSGSRKQPKTGEEVERQWKLRRLGHIAPEHM
jgi:site-specific DNA-cytosine methylase